jgi:hypothetical protein
MFLQSFLIGGAIGLCNGILLWLGENQARDSKPVQ